MYNSILPFFNIIKLRFFGISGIVSYYYFKCCSPLVQINFFRLVTGAFGQLGWTEIPSVRARHRGPILRLRIYIIYIIFVIIKKFPRRGLNHHYYHWWLQVSINMEISIELIAIISLSWSSSLVNKGDSKSSSSCRSKVNLRFPIGVYLI